MKRLSFTETEKDVLLEACAQLQAGEWDATGRQAAALDRVCDKLLNGEKTERAKAATLFTLRNGADVEKAKLAVLFTAIHALAEAEMAPSYVRTLDATTRELCSAALDVVAAARAFDDYVKTIA